MSILTDFLDWLNSPAEGVSAYSQPQPAQPPQPAPDMSVRPFVAKLAELYERCDYVVEGMGGFMYLRFASHDDLSVTLHSSDIWELKKYGKRYLRVNWRNVELTDGEQRLFTGVDERLAAEEEAKKQKAFDDTVARVLAYQPKETKP